MNMFKGLSTHDSTRSRIRKANLLRHVAKVENEHTSSQQGE